MTNGTDGALTFKGNTFPFYAGLEMLVGFVNPTVDGWKLNLVGYNLFTPPGAIMRDAYDMLVDKVTGTVTGSSLGSLEAPWSYRINGTVIGCPLQTLRTGTSMII